VTETRITLLERLASAQLRRPWWFIVLAIALAVPALLLARGLPLKTGFESLLPDNKPSVRELGRVASRTTGVSNFTIVADGSDRAALIAFGDALLPQLRALGPGWVGTAENGVQAEQEFMNKRRALFLPLDKIKDLHQRIEDRFDYEVHGSLTGDEPEKITRETIEKELGKNVVSGPPYPGGYYMNVEGTRLVTVIRTPIAIGDLAGTAQLRAKIDAVIAGLAPGNIKVAYTGDLVTSAEQYAVVKDDLATVGVAGILMILFVDWLFFLRFRAVLAMGVSIGIGVLWCFAITRLVIGHLNTASGFLVSIIFGNGINFGVLLRARFNEARRAGASLEDAVGTAYRDTFRPTLTVAAAASVGYVSLATTDFRGFRDFGAIGGYGMLLCWLANYLFMVPLLVLSERLFPTFLASPPRSRLRAFLDRGIPFGAPFAALARRVPARATAIVGVALAVIAAATTLRWAKNDPMEYDMGKLENNAGAPSAASKLGSQISALTGRLGNDGMAIMVDRLDQVQPLTAALHARRDATPGSPPFGRVVSIFDLVPDQQGEKAPLLREMRARIDRIRELGKINDDDWRAVEPYLPPRDIAPYTIADLPERVARPFTEADGTRGRVVYITKADGASVRDVKYLRRWADAYRRTELPTGEVIVGSGRAVIFADMLEGVMEEAPKAIVLSFLGTVVVVVLSFARGRGGRRATLLVLAALLAGLSWMGGAMAVLGVRLNFLNFIAFPITVGIGVDYAINVVHRWRLEGPGQIPRIVRETGGAVVLCSLTTTLGYLALLRSVNAAVRSFGLAAVIGEVACLLAVVVVLPAALQWIESRDAAPATEGVGAVHNPHAEPRAPASS